MVTRSGMASEVDKGWAWVVLVAAFFNCVVTAGMCFQFSVYQSTYLNSNGHINTWTLLQMPSIIVLLTAPLSHLFTKHLGYMWTQILGGTIGAVALQIIFLTDNTHLIVLSVGLLIGFGSGLVLITSLTVLKFFFLTRYFLANAVGTMGISVGTLLMPFLISYLRDLYGIRGSLLLISGLYLNICGGSLVLLYRSPDFRDHIESHPLTTNHRGNPYPFPKPMRYLPNRAKGWPVKRLDGTLGDSSRRHLKKVGTTCVPSLKRCIRKIPWMPDDVTRSEILGTSPAKLRIESRSRERRRRQTDPNDTLHLTVDVLFVVLRLKAWRTGLLLATGFLSQMGYHLMILVFKRYYSDIIYVRASQITWMVVGHVVGHVLVVVWGMVEDLGPDINSSPKPSVMCTGQLVYKGIPIPAYRAKILKRLTKASAFQSSLLIHSLLCVSFLLPHTRGTVPWLPLMLSSFGTIFGIRQSLLTSVLTGLFGPQQFFAAFAYVVMANGAGATSATIILRYIPTLLDERRTLTICLSALSFVLAEAFLLSFTVRQVKRHVVQLMKCRSKYLVGSPCEI